MHRAMRAGIAAAAAALGTATPAGAVTTMLDFGSGLCGIAATPQCGDSGEYGQSYGDSPIVNVSYRVINVPPPPSFRLVTSRHGDLVVFRPDKTALTGRISEITLTPAPGYEVSLLGFDGACTSIPAFCSALPYLLTSGATTLASGSIAARSGGFSSLTLDTAYQRNAIVLRWSPEGDLAGLDNITFDVRRDAVAGVPEPGTWALMIGGVGAAGTALRRRRRVLARA